MGGYLFVGRAAYSGQFIFFKNAVLWPTEINGLDLIPHHWPPTKASVDERSKSLRLQLLEWLVSHPRTYSETMDAWRTSCPRLSIWEDACIDGLIESETGTPYITVSAMGLAFIEESRRR
jgi:hypothetical protein